MAAIRWRDQDKKELQRTVKNFNAKIRYWEKKGVEGLPDTVKMGDLTELITTRQDFNRELNRLERFSRRGAEQTVTLDSGLTLTKWERQELGRSKAIINRKRKRIQDELAKMEATYMGQPLGLKRGEMGSARMNAYNPRVFNVDNLRNRAELRKLNLMLAQERSSAWFDQRTENLKYNYIKGLYNIFGQAAMPLMDHIEQIHTFDFYRTFIREQWATIDFMYGYDDFHMKMEILLEVWDYPKDEREDLLHNLDRSINSNYTSYFEGFEGYDGFS